MGKQVDESLYFEKQKAATPSHWLLQFHMHLLLSCRRQMQQEFVHGTQYDSSN